MTTTITVSTDTPNGTIIVSKSVADDAKAQRVFTLVAEYIGATGTPRERLEAVLGEMIRQLILLARHRNRHLKALEADAEEQEINLD